MSDTTTSVNLCVVCGLSRPVKAATCVNCGADVDGNLEPADTVLRLEYESTGVVSNAFRITTVCSRRTLRKLDSDAARYLDPDRQFLLAFDQSVKQWILRSYETENFTHVNGSAVDPGEGGVSISDGDIISVAGKAFFLKVRTSSD